MDEHESGDPPSEVNASLWGVVRLYIDLSRPSRLKLAAALFLLCVTLVMYLAFALAMGNLVDGSLNQLGALKFQSGRAISGWGVNAWALCLLILVAVNMASNFFEFQWFQVIGERAAADLRVRLFGRLVGLPMNFYASANVGELSSRVLADVALLQEGWIHDVRNALSYVATAATSIVMLFVVSPALSVFVFLIAIPVIALSVWFGKRIAGNSRRLQDSLGRTSVIVEEALRGIHGVKIFATEETEKVRFGKAITGYLEAAVWVARHRSGLFCGILFVLMNASVFVIWYGSWEIQKGRLTPGEFTSFMFFLGFLGNAGGMLAQLMGRVQRMSGATARVKELLNETAEELEIPARGDGWVPEKDARLKGEVEFCGVSFSYPGRAETRVLEGIDLKLEAGRYVALTGPSGSGKSTLTSLLFRLFDPSEGTLLIDGRDARSYPLGWLRSQMAMAPQDAVLFSGSVAENIAYGRSGAAREQIEAAARQANAMEFIERLPEGFDTLMGDRGVTLSGGQRQRIAIARAVLCDPMILVMDEAASALDPESERLVREAMEGLIRKRTSLVIAHRISTVRCADEIVVLREGRIVERGTHDRLYDANRFYRRLCDEDDVLVDV